MPDTRGKPVRSWLPRGFGKYVSLRDMAIAWAPAGILVAIVVAIASGFIEPAPPKKLVLAVGSEDGAYWAAARRYQEILARNDIELKLKRSSGSIENLKGLSISDADIDVGFVQGGTGDAQQAPDLVSFGSLFYEPFWVFYRSPQTFNRLTELRRLRIAVGPVGSGTRQLAFTLFRANGMQTGELTLSDLSGREAAAALKKGEIDAVVLVASPEARSVRALLTDPKLKLMNFAQAEAYARQFPFLSVVVLPAGTIDLSRNLPAQDIHLVATTANLLMHRDLHPALVSLLAAALIETHRPPGLFQRDGEFPSINHIDFPASEEAARYYKSGPPFLQRFLPFWAAVWVDRLIVLLIPLIAIAIPLARIVPPLYNWRISSRIYRNYGQLRFLEDEIARNPEPEKINGYLAKLDEIEQQINRLPVPLAFNNQLYTLREHINLVRMRIAGLVKSA